MKKFTFILLSLFLGISVFAQKATNILSEDFSGGVPPASWTIDGMTSQWSSSATAKAGGAAPEAKLKYLSGTNTTYLISPVIDLTGYSSVVFSFKHFLDDFSGSGYTIGVATRSGGSSSWNNVWSTNPAGDIGPETKDLIISNADVGASDFQISIYLTGNTYNFDNWYIDDIVLFAPDADDAAMQSININPYSSAGNIDIKCSFKNAGINNIISVNLNYQIDNGSVITENVNGLNLTTTQTSNFVFSNLWSATPGNYNLKVWISDINGNGNDDDQNNDTLNLIMHIATQEVSRTPLYEEFTSSTCSPCANFNSSYFNETFLNNNTGNYTLIKYQMSWPSPGDPYYTDEGGTRRAFYGVSGVPTLFLDAQEGTFLNSGQLQTALDNENAIPAFFTISGKHQIFGNTISIDTDILPYLDASNFTVHTVVVEKKTTGNTGNNGETEFYYVMMKMLPDALGTTLDFTAGNLQNINTNFDMSSTFVEEMNDLAVVAFIQNNETKQIFQSAWIPLDISAEITPSDGSENVVIDKSVVIDFSGAVRKIDDSEIINADINSFCHLSDSSKGDIPFTATINDSKTKITIDPDNNFSPNTVITFTFDGNAVESTNDVSFIGGSITFKTGTETDINNINELNISVSPNPANNYISIKGAKNTMFILTDISGKQVISQNINSENEQINIQNLKSGIYFAEITAAGYVYTTKIIKN